MPKVVLKGFIRVSSVDLEIVKSHLDDHIRLSRSEPGCLVFSVSQREANPSIFDVYEEFKDTSSFAAHQTHTRLSPWGKATKTIERHYETSGLVPRSGPLGCRVVSATISHCRVTGAVGTARLNGFAAKMKVRFTRMANRPVAHAVVERGDVVGLSFNRRWA